MYKDRIKRWGLAKNIKKHEAAAILRIKSERDSLGKMTSIELHNQAVDIKRLLRHTNRRVTKHKDQSLPMLPPYIQCTTPPLADHASSTSSGNTTSVGKYSGLTQSPPEPSSTLSSASRMLTQAHMSLAHAPADFGNGQISKEAPQLTFYDVCDDTILEQSSIAWPLSLPTGFRIQEQLLYTITSHFACSLHSEAWEASSHDCTANQVGVALRNHNGTFGAYCFTALEFWRRGLLVQFRRVLSKAYEIIPDILRAAFPRTLVRLFGVCVAFIREGAPEVAQSLCRYVAQMAANLAMRPLPWKSLCRLLGDIEDESLEETLIASWECTNDSLRRGFGRFTRISLRAELHFLEVVYDFDDRFKEERLLRVLLNDFEVELGPGDWLTIRITISLVENLLMQGRNLEAEDLANGILIASSFEEDSEVTSKMQINVLGLLASSQYDRGAFCLAEQSMRRSIDMMRQEWGIEHPWTVRGTARLEGWLQEWDRVEDAHTLQLEMNRIIGSDETDR